MAEKIEVTYKLQPHPSHTMGDWESTIVTIIATSRFGYLRRCTKCEAEHAVTVAGEAMHDELKVPCEEG